MIGLLDDDEVIWEQLDFESAWLYFRRAQRRTKIRTKNRRRKSEPSKKSDKEEKDSKVTPRRRKTGLTRRIPLLRILRHANLELPVKDMMLQSVVPGMVNRLVSLLQAL